MLRKLLIREIYIFDSFNVFNIFYWNILDKILFKKIVRLDNFSLWKEKVLYLLNDYPRIFNDYLLNIFYFALLKTLKTWKFASVRYILLYDFK